MHEPNVLKRDRGMVFSARWDWHELQIVDGDRVPGTSMAGEALTIKQHCGRRLEFARFYQYPTHGGLLAGMRQARDSTLEEAILIARDLFGEGDEAVALLRPRLRRLPPAADHDPALPVARLPLVTTIAVFNSGPAGEEEALQSSAVVIWFQEHFGMPVDPHVIMQIVDLDWPAHARDWKQ